MSQQKEQFLSKRKRYRPISLPQSFSDEEMARDWTLSEDDKQEISKYSRKFRLFIAIEMCAVRLYGRFLTGVHDLSPRIISYLNHQLNFPPTLTVKIPERKATYLTQHQRILTYLGFQRFDDTTQKELEGWLEQQARHGTLPDELYAKAETYLLNKQILLPGVTILERLIIHITSQVHLELFEIIYKRLSPELQQSMDDLLTADGSKQSLFNQLKAYPPTAKISSLKTYLKRYQKLSEVNLDIFDTPIIEPAFQAYLFKLTKKYDVKALKGFNASKRYALMTCFLLETQKVLLDHLVEMHDQYMMELVRKTKNSYEKKLRQFRKRQKRAVKVVLDASQWLLEWPNEEPLLLAQLWQQVNKSIYKRSIEDLQTLRHLHEKGYAELLLAKYPSLRKYFSLFVYLPFAAERGSTPLIQALQLVQQLDSGQIRQLPPDAPTIFVPKELRVVLKDRQGNINRNAWEMGLAFAIKDALRSGDIYLPQSKHHVSFWHFMLNNNQWQAVRETSYEELQQPHQEAAFDVITEQFHQAVIEANERFESDTYAQIQAGKLKLKRNDKIAIPPSVVRLQKAIHASLPAIRIENLLKEVDQLIHFSHHFVPLQGHQYKPKLFYKTLMAALISQATNLGVVAMSASVKDISVDMIRHVQHFFIREETLQAANAAIVNEHHQLPLSTIYGDGSISSSDAQRFAIRASSLLASYYPRYYGYYKRAISIYTHVSDQYSVFNTKVISCGPREALYVLDGLLENNSILPTQQHTTDTHGYTEIIFALCHLLGYYFMPRIRDLKDQQLYRLDKTFAYGVFTPLLNKTVDLAIVVEQWDQMMRVIYSLKHRTVPAHIIVQRLTNSFPADRLSKAFTNLGRIIKTQYILRYLTDQTLRQTVQRQLNKGEYRHKLPRWIFFANQGEFTRGDYESIMNKASSLSLVSYAILYWNTIKIQGIVDKLKLQGEAIPVDALSHISLLPFKHVLPNGTYFIDKF